MSPFKTAFLAIAFTATILTTAGASGPDVGMVIERFVYQRFPNAHEHFWVINQATVEEDEVTVDVSTVVRVPPREVPVAERFLLLIVNGQLAAAQMVPLDGEADCKPEEA